MERKKITVVIAVYNSACHLQKGLDSLEHQTMKASDIEIIFVDDCSTDESRKVIERYAARMKNIRLIHLEKNTGSPIRPRNTGIEAASGKYIHFMDDDDFLGDEALERLYTAAERLNSDVIFGRHVGVNGRQVPQTMFGKGNLAKANLLKDNLVFSLAPHKMFRASFLKENDLRFHKDATGGNEDQLFVMQCYLKANRITLLDDYDYYFVVGRGEKSYSRHRFSAHSYFFVPYQVMKCTEEEITDRILCKKIKAAYIDRFLTTERLRKYLVSINTSTETKKEWLQNGKRFLDTYLDAEIMQLIAKQNLDLIRLIQSNDVAAVQRAARHRREVLTAKKKSGDVYFAKAKKLKTTAFLRPSPSASPSHYRLPAQTSFQVFFSVDKWLEVRHAKNGRDTDAFFVKQQDVRCSNRLKIQLLLRRLKVRLKRKIHQTLWRHQTAG